MSGHTPGPWYDNGNASLRRVFPVGSASPIAGIHMRKKNAAEQAANARLIAASPLLLAACKALLACHERSTCTHEETYRGRSIWEICHQCGARWADDEGGKPKWQDPPEWEAARAAIAAAEGEPS